MWVANLAVDCVAADCPPTGFDAAVGTGEYSFLLAIPAILGAALLQLPDLTREAVAIGRGPLLVGFASSLTSGIFAIRVLVALARRGRFQRFAPYCLELGLLTFGWVLIG
ncbi:MAG: hypothetical protein AMS18_11595 [Gemmatimonas sp. SG8_17]|nr:MAG: hypothetical protein AMS18_11595 [Gemmatimonas sp. SG8_17]